MASTYDKPIVVDPENEKTVRFTDNSAKESDFYPEDQTPKPLFLDPAGAPYALLDEVGGFQLGQDEASDEQALKDNAAWALAEELKKAEQEVAGDANS